MCVYGYVCVVCFFFKQKTAYEMRISDGVQTCALPILDLIGVQRSCGNDFLNLSDRDLARCRHVRIEVPRRLSIDEIAFGIGFPGLHRSEERRVGKDCVSKCSSRW